MTTTRFTVDVPCRLCGGTYGSGQDGAHCLCTARARLSLPTPSLGEQCPRCEGRGWWRADGGPQPGAALPVYFNPAECARGVTAIFPPCLDCGGRGHVGGPRP